MSVTITAPTSRIIPRGTTNISWTSSYPQSAYEILYREVGSTAWQTFGRVTSVAQSINLDVSKLIDFKEYHFRVVVYSTNATSGTTIYNGSDKSLAYSLIVTPNNKIADMKAKYGDKMVEVPVYSESNAEASTRVSMGNGVIGTVPAVSIGTATASEHHFAHPHGKRAFADDNPIHYTYSYEPKETYVIQDSRNTLYRYYYSYGYRSYYVANYLSSYSGHTASYYRGTYLAGYSTFYDKTYYRGYYISGTSAAYNKTYLKGYYLSASITKYDKTYYCGYYMYNGSYQASYTVYYSSCPGTYYVTYYYDCTGLLNRLYYYSYNSHYAVFELYCTTGQYYRGSVTVCSTNFIYGSYRPTIGGMVYGQYYGYYRYYTTTYSAYYGYYRYNYNTYAQYYGYYRYTTSGYANYYGYYYYALPNYSPYYNYYRYSSSYRQTYYTYTRAYHYA